MVQDAAPEIPPRNVHDLSTVDRNPLAVAAASLIFLAYSSTRSLLMPYEGDRYLRKRPRIPPS